MNTSLKLAVSDIDGTLVDSRKCISPLNRRAIDAFQNGGGAFTLATGRIEKSALPYCRELKIQVPVILYNGARIVHPLSGEVLLDRQLHEEDVNRALALREGYPLDYILYSEGEAYVFGRSSLIREFERGDGYECCVLKDPGQLTGKKITKILMIGENSCFETFRKEFRKDRKTGAVLVQSESNYLEILPEGVNKGTALEELEKILGLSPKNVICFGDNHNDIEMISRAGIGVAMGNAGDEVKAAADLIAPDHNHDGVGRILADKTGIADSIQLKASPSHK